MIKIEIPAIDDVKIDYLKAISEPVKKRVESLIVSLKHLNGEPIDVNASNFDLYKHVTRKIVNRYINSVILDDTLFDKKQYHSTVVDFIQNSTKKKDYSTINFNGLIQFLTFLISPNTDELDKLLVCDASSLKQTNDAFLNDYSITGDDHKYILARAFNYKEFNADISSNIKFFFRTNNFVKFCPYCNLTEVEYIPNESGSGAATSNELDHFFDKASFPLLCYSFFNLVPSDSTCNGTENKGTIEFTDQFHLNPYIGGFGKKMVFVPVLIGNKVDCIKVNVLATPTEPIFSRMLGSIGEIRETFPEGNINVFSIHSKYRTRTRKAEKILKKVYRADKGRRGLDGFWNQMDLVDRNEHYKVWYEDEIDTFFEEDKFHENAYSKFNRDIHDFYFRRDSSSQNDFIRQMIDE